MSAAPEELSFWSKVATGASALVLTLSAVLFSTVQHRISGHARKIEALEKEKADKVEAARCLDHIEKLYGAAEDDRRFTRDLHDKAMTEIRDGQRQIIDAIAGLK